MKQILDRIEKLDDTKGLVRSCKLKNRRKYNDQTLFGTGNRIEMFGDTKEGNQKPTVNWKSTNNTMLVLMYSNVQLNFNWSLSSQLTFSVAGRTVPIVFRIMFCQPLLGFFSPFYWPWHYLSFFNLRVLIIILASSNFSNMLQKQIDMSEKGEKLKI